MIEHAGSIVPRALHGVGLYKPTPAEARADLRRWSAGRKEHAPALGPVPWQAVATDAVLAELERLEALDRGMVVTDLAAWDAEVVG